MAGLINNKFCNILIVLLLILKDSKLCMEISYKAALEVYKYQKYPKTYENFVQHSERYLRKRFVSFNEIVPRNHTNTRNFLKMFNLNGLQQDDANENNQQDDSLIKLINKIAKEYLYKCPPIIYYDAYMKNNNIALLQKLFLTFPLSYYQFELNEDYTIINESGNGNFAVTHCKSFILFLKDPVKTRSIIGPQLTSKVVVVSKSTQWKLREFLKSSESLNILHLLVIGESLTTKENGERPYILYTHQLYADALGYSKPVVLTSWYKNNLSRPHIDLFPQKFQTGFSGHRFQVMAANQPPFIFRLRSLDFQGVSRIKWEGIEYRLLAMISEKLNFSFDIHDTPHRKHDKNSIDSMIYYINENKIDIGMSGIYITKERLFEAGMSHGHSRDCAAFVTLASKALPKYRAIMGPFQWPVWVVLTFVYLGAIFLVAYSDRLTLSHLIGNWFEIENMFWYVFGMFTNAFSFTGKYSWTRSRKWSTRILIGSYWIFTIIITSCYTGSIIAFVTLPAFPDTVDSVNDLLGLFFRVVTLDNGGWELWFRNSTHEETSRLYKKMEYVSTLEEGIKNVTNSFIWNYAFLGSKSRLEYLIQANFSNENLSKRSALHLSSECFASFRVGFLYPKNAVFKQKLDAMILLAQQSGLMQKIENDVKWNMQRSSTGKLLQASSSSTLREAIEEERQLTTADTEGMFLLMALGYLMGIIALISEIAGGIGNKCSKLLKQKTTTFSRSHKDQPLFIKETISSNNSLIHEMIDGRNLDFPEVYSRSYINLMVDQLLNTERFNDLLPKCLDINEENSYNQETSTKVKADRNTQR